MLDHIAEMNTTEQLASQRFLVDQLTEAQKKLADAVEALRSFKTRNNTILFAEETGASIKLIADLEKKSGGVIGCRILERAA